MDIQLDFFEEYDDLSIMKKQMEEMQLSLDKQRRCQFSMLSSLGKELIKIREEMDRIRDMMIYQVK
jgi:hypothetical protein